MKKQRVTILTGAGFTLSDEFGGPSTIKLTKKLRELEIKNFSIGKDQKTPGEYFYKILCDNYELSIDNGDLSVINFETIIHLLEEIYSYQTSRKVKDTSSIHLFRTKGIKPSFLVLKTEIEEDLSDLEKKAGTRNIAEAIKIIYYHFIDAIVDELRALNSDKNNKGMRNFLNSFLQRHFPETKFTRRIYTLNYDTWLNKYSHFSDGFNSSGHFQTKKVMEEFHEDCHYNLHGSILWKNSNHEITKVGLPFSHLRHDPYSNVGLNRELLISSPIITGYNKLERMKFKPYLQLYYSLQKDILDSDLLILIGYSFSDLHVNNIISLFEKKGVVVDKIGSWDNAASYDDSIGIKVKPIKAIKSSDWDFQHLVGKNIKDSWVKSKNGNIRFWWKGVDDDFYNAWKRIIV
jgi:hypothetical protein